MLGKQLNSLQLRGEVWAGVTILDFGDMKNRKLSFFGDRKTVKVAQLFLTLCHPMDYAVHGILQARILEWVAFPFSRGSSQPRDRTQVSLIAGRFFTS